MITNFALSLSSDGIELLHRVPRGWRRVGQVDVDSATLEADLADLRDKALTIAPDGLRTKLVIPLDQIKYLALDGTMTTEDDIHAALTGATPYALDELVIDSEKFGGRTHIAAVARETLQEAEAFAAAHGFQPVAFVAIPEPFTFQQEVFFGPTQMARDVVGPDAIIDRDELPVMVVGTRIKSRLLVLDLPEEVQEEVYKDDLASLLATVDGRTKDNDHDDDGDASSAPMDPAAAETGVGTADTSSKSDAPAARAIWIDRVPPEYLAPEPLPNLTQEGPRYLPEAPKLAKPALLDAVIAEYHPAKADQSHAPLVAVYGSTVNAAPKLAAVPERPRPSEPANTNKRPLYAGLGIAASVLLLAGLFWSQQGAPQDPVSVAPVPTVAAEGAPAPQPAPVVEAANSPVLEAAPSVPILELEQPAPPAPAQTALAELTPIAPATRLFAFEPLAVEDADTANITVLPPPAPPAPETAQASVGAPILRGQVLSPDEAARIYAATGVWLRAPRFLDVPSGTIPLQFTAPAEALGHDRIAQPLALPRDGLETDLSFIAPNNPPPPEITFPRDENGFILATEEGTVTPEGAIVFAGLPDIAMTPRPELSQADLDRMALLAPAPEGVVLIAGRPDVVPPLRPANARLPDTVPDAPVTDASQTETVTPGSVGIAGLELQNSGAIALEPETVENNALIDLRPRLRPQGLASIAEASTPDITDIIAGIATDDATLRFDNSTTLAVVLSLRPDERPANFGNVVAAALARQQTRPVAPTAPVAAAAPVPPQNFEPVPGGVARAATQEDAIRLREINLIGVYGRPNARRALVRLSNGRYVRVEVGSALDGGQVTAIGDNALNYVKRGRTFAIELP